VDYTHAFDSVYQNKRMECLIKFELPDKLIRLIVLTLTHTRARIKINRDFTEEFIVKCGVKQGDSLSTILFSLVIDTILKQMELRGNITTCLKRCTAYADDILLTTRTKQFLLDTFQKLKETLAQNGLIVNGQKKNLRCTRKNYKLEELQINYMYLEQIQSYKYLGLTVNSDNSIDEEIQYSITLGNKAYYANQSFFKSKLVSKKSKLKLYWNIIRPVVTYACAAWVLKETIN
jgi:hypothetical protein